MHVFACADNVADALIKFVWINQPASVFTTRTILSFVLEAFDVCCTIRPCAMCMQFDRTPKFSEIFSVVSVESFDWNVLGFVNLKLDAFVCASNNVKCGPYGGSNGLDSVFFFSAFHRLLIP